MKSRKSLIHLTAAILIMCAGFWFFFGGIVTSPRSSFETIVDFQYALEGIRDKNPEVKSRIASKELHTQIYYTLFGADNEKHFREFTGIILVLNVLSFFLLCTAFTKNYYLCAILPLIVVSNPFLLRMSYLNCWNRTILFFVFLALYFFHRAWNEKKWRWVPGIALFFILSFISYYYYGAFIGAYMLLYIVAHPRSITKFHVVAGILIVGCFAGYCYSTLPMIIRANHELAQQTITMYSAFSRSYWRDIITVAVLLLLIFTGGRRIPIFLTLFGTFVFSLSLGDYLCSGLYEYVSLFGRWIQLPGYWVFKIDIINRLREISTFAVFGIALLGMALAARTFPVSYPPEGQTKRKAEE